MLNYIWPIFLIVSFIYGICFGNIEKTNMAIFESTESAVNLCIKLLGTMCFWSGIMKIAEKTSIVNKLKKFLAPVLKVLFPKLKKDEKAYAEISMNMVANIMGIRKCCDSDGVKGYAITAGKK